MLILMGDIGSSGSGSKGSTTLSRNRFGAYLRSRVKPVNPNSGRQQAARLNFKAAAEFWSGSLTQGQRDAWNQYANAVPWLNAIGQQVYLTGYNMFVRTMTLTLSSSLTDVADGPTILTLPETDPTFAVTISEATQQLSVTFDDTLAWANEDDAAMQVSMGSPKGVGRQFLGGPFRVAGTILGDSITAPTTPALISTPFSVAADQKADIFARVIRADGRVSNPFWDSVVVAA